MECMQEKEFRLEHLLPLIQETLHQGKSVTFSPRGISMLPMLRQGRDTVTLVPIDRKLEKYDIPLYRRDNGAFILHRIVKTGDTFTCIGDNQFELECGIRPDQMIGVVESFTRDGRIVNVTDMGYRVYCRFWHWLRPLRRIFVRAKRLAGRVLRKMQSIIN